MPRRKKNPIDEQTRASLRVAPAVKITDARSRMLDAYFTDVILPAITARDALAPRIRKWRSIIAGKRDHGPIRPGASNLSVPLIIWARVAVRARLFESIMESSPLLHVEPLAPPADTDDAMPQTIANDLARFMQSQILNTRGLDGRRATERVISELVDLGTGGLKVVPVMDTVRKLGPSIDAPDAQPRYVPVPGHVRWEHIPFEDLVFPDGYGTDTQEMPFIGQEFRQTWAEIRTWGEIGHYDRAVVNEIRETPAQNQNAKPIDLREHNMVEVYLDFDVDEDGIQESILCTWHKDTRKRVRAVWTPIPDGRRPILMAPFDLPGDITDAQGQGVCAKLEGIQDEVDAIHNIGIESGKRGAAHIVILREGTRAEEEFGGDDDVLPGDVIVTGNPDEDVKAIPLGDPGVAMALANLEEHDRMYVTRILGLDESRTGNVESGKRVPASLGLASMREGRIVVKSAMSAVANMLNEATYLTLDLYKRNIPIEALISILGEDSARSLMETVFSLPDVSSRSSFLIRVNAQDAALAQEKKMNEAMVVGQALFPFWDRQERLIMSLSNPTLPPNARKPLLTLMERMERGMEALLNTVDFVQKPEELLLKVNQLVSMLDSAGTPAISETGDPNETDTLVGDLGEAGGA